MADKVGGPEDDDSLDKFEEKMADDEKKKARKQGYLIGLVLVFVIAAGAYYYFNYYAAPAPEAPAPAPAPAPKVEAPKVEKPAPVPEKPAEMVKAAPTVDKKTSKKAKPEKEAKKGKETAPATKAAGSAPAVEKKPAAEKAAVKPGTSTVQLGIFRIESNAKKLAERLEKAGLTAELVGGSMKLGTVVYYEPKFKYREQADEASAKLLGDGFKNKVVITGAGEYSIEVARFVPDKKSDSPVAKMKEKGYETRSVPKAAKSGVTIVRISGITDEAKLRETIDKLEKEKIPFVVQKH
jgi:hypothetical protein